jgi:hypothetical protein
MQVWGRDRVVEEAKRSCWMARDRRQTRLDSGPFHTLSFRTYRASVLEGAHDVSASDGCFSTCLLAEPAD